MAMRLSREQLRRESRHVYYEVTTLVHACRRLQVEDDPLTRCLILEAWALHLRNIVEFLWEPNRDRLCAWHYVESWEKPGPRPNGLVARLNTLVTHLGAERSRMLHDTESWQFIDDTKRILTAFASFDAVVDPELIELRGEQLIAFEGADIAGAAHSDASTSCAYSSISRVMFLPRKVT